MFVLLYSLTKWLSILRHFNFLALLGHVLRQKETNETATSDS